MKQSCGSGCGFYVFINTVDSYRLSVKQDLILIWIRNNFDSDPTQIQQQPEVAALRIYMFLGLLDPDPLVRGMDPDPVRICMSLTIMQK